MSRTHDNSGLGWRGLAAQTPALVISVIALALSVGGAAYASTQITGGRSQGVSHATTRSVTNTVAFQALTLINGWTSEQGTYDTGNPSVGIQDGVVYLSGSLDQATPGSSSFANLPTTYRPKHDVYITVYTNADTSGTLYIGKNGEMEAYGPGNLRLGQHGPVLHLTCRSLVSQELLKARPAGYCTNEDT